MKSALLCVVLASIAVIAACSTNPVMDEVAAAEPAEPAMQGMLSDAPQVDKPAVKPEPPARQSLVHATQKLSPYRHPHASRHSHLKHKRH